MNFPQRIDAVLIVRDEAEMLPGCLRSLNFVEQIHVGVDTRTTDDSALVAERAGAKVFSVTFTDFASAKSGGLEAALEADWVLIVDADERISWQLADEIVRRVQKANDEVLGFRVPRRNFFHGQEMRFGGWRSEAPVRLVRSGVAIFDGAVHETLSFTRDGRVEDLQTPMIHFTHRSVEHVVAKDWLYIDLGASKLFAQGASTVTTWRMNARLGKIFFRRFIVKRAWRDGPAGVFDAIRVISAEAATLMRLRELQRGYDPVMAYRKLDQMLQSGPGADD